MKSTDSKLQKRMKQIIANSKKDYETLYKIGWAYLANENDVLKAIRATIVQIAKGLEPIKKNPQFKQLMTDVLIEECKQILLNRNDAGAWEQSSQGNVEPRLFEQLSTLEPVQQDFIILKYVGGLDDIYMAQLAGIRPDNVDKVIYHGLERLQVEANYACRELGEQAVAFLEGSMLDADRIELEQHLAECDYCTEELEIMRQTIEAIMHEISEMPNPPAFTDLVKSLTGNGEASQKRLAIQLGIAMVAVLLFISTTAMVGRLDIRSGWLNKMAFAIGLKKDYGERLSISAIDQDVKITITDVVADQYRSVLYYTIEDLKKKRHYDVDFYQQNIVIDNLDTVWPTWGSSVMEHIQFDNNSYMSPYWLKEQLDNKDKTYVKTGKIQLPAFDKRTGKLEFSIKQVREFNIEKLYEPGKELKGEWKFSIPYETFEDEIVYPLNQQTELDGNLVAFQELTITPTITNLTYKIKKEQPYETIMNMIINSIEADNREKRQVPFNEGISYGGSDDWEYRKISFESLYLNIPDEVKINFGDYMVNVMVNEQFPIDYSKPFPQTFKFDGNDVTIEAVDPGPPVTVEIVEEYDQDRSYDYLQLSLTGEQEEYMSFGTRMEGYYVDRKGKIYQEKDVFDQFFFLERPRFFSWKQTIEIDPTQVGVDPALPTHIRIDGYSRTELMDETVTLKLDHEKREHDQ